MEGTVALCRGHGSRSPREATARGADMAAEDGERRSDATLLRRVMVSAAEVTASRGRGGSPNTIRDRTPLLSVRREGDRGLWRRPRSRSTKAL